MKTLKLAIALIALFGAINASAYTGNELLSDLQSDDRARSLGGMRWIIGYIEGMRDSSLDFTCRDGVTYGQINDAVRIYLERNPNLRDTSAGVHVYVAVATAGICRYDKTHGEQQIEKLKEHLRERNRK